MLRRALKFELDQKYYHYGDHFKGNREAGSSIFKKIKRKLGTIRATFYFFRNNFAKKPTHDKIIVSTAYLSANKRISAKALNTTNAPWAPGPESPSQYSFSLFLLCKKFEEELVSASPKELISVKFQDKILHVKKALKEFYSQKNIVGGLFPNDIGFFETISIAVLKELNKKSFIFIHGVPAYYEKGTYDSGDFLLVYGESLRTNLIKMGLDPEKVLVVGHPKIKPQSNEVRSSLDNIVVLGSSLPGAQLKLNEVTLWDRGNIILYCHQIQKVLEGLGVKQVTFRPHPSENARWYEKHIDLDFFKLDSKISLEKVLDQSTLVIGPSSTIALEALNLGVNYIVYEPFDQKSNKESSISILVPPFDGSDDRLLVAKTLAELREFIIKNRKSSSALLSDYSQAEYTLEESILSRV